MQLFADELRIRRVKENGDRRSKCFEDKLEIGTELKYFPNSLIYGIWNGIWRQNIVKGDLTGG